MSKKEKVCSGGRRNIAAAVFKIGDRSWVSVITIIFCDGDQLICFAIYTVAKYMCSKEKGKDYSGCLGRDML